MADLSDVLTALTNLVAAAVYPNGTSAASAITAPCRVFPGWPAPAQLDADLTNGTVNISVFPRPDGQNTTRFPNVEETVSHTTPTITIATSGATATIGGTGGAGQN